MIPKKLHFMWLPDIEQAPPAQRETPVMWVDLNPGYDIHFWSYDEIRNLIRNQYPDFLDIWENLDMPVKQADLARLFISHHVGGFYLDMDLHPLRPLDEWLEDGCVYNRFMEGTEFPDVPSKHYRDLKSFTTILSKEHRPIDKVGVGIANGIICVQPGEEWILDFIEEQKFSYRGKVLDYVGTWALTRFLRKRYKKMVASGQLQLMPPHYFLWEIDPKVREPLPYSICTHDPMGTSWYDPHKKGGWKI